MKTSLVIALLLCPSIVAAQAPSTPPPGMAAYYVGFMTRGVAAGTPGGEATQKAHLAHLTKLFEAGDLLASGPMMDKGDLRGLLIFRDRPRAEVQSFVEQDPAVNAGRLKVELRPWWGPAGIGAAYAAQYKINPNAPDKMQVYHLALLRRTAKPQGPAAEAEALGKAHMAHINDMAKQGALVVAGPFLEGDLAGLFIFTGRAEDAARLAAADPLVKAGRLTIELHPWAVATGVLPEGFKPPQP